MRKVFSWACLVCLCSAPLAAQAELYRYIDNKGVTVLDSWVPPEFVSNGYEVLDPQGRVKLSVPAAPTPQELEAARQARADQERQRTSDATLLRLYSSPADLDRAQARQIAQIENQISTSRASLLSLKAQREELQRKAAEQERAGRVVDPSILLQLKGIESETGRLNRLVKRKRTEIQEVTVTFAAQRERLVTLVGE